MEVCECSSGRYNHPAAVATRAAVAARREDSSVNIQRENRTPERMGHFEAFLVMLEHDGFGDLAYPFVLPLDELRQCATTEEQWVVADRWLLGVRYSPVTGSLNHEDESHILTLKRRVAEWRHREGV